MKPYITTKQVKAYKRSPCDVPALEKFFKEFKKEDKIYLEDLLKKPFVKVTHLTYIAQHNKDFFYNNIDYKKAIIKMACLLIDLVPHPLLLSLKEKMVLGEDVLVYKEIIRKISVYFNGSKYETLFACLPAACGPSKNYCLPNLFVFAEACESMVEGGTDKVKNILMDSIL